MGGKNQTSTSNTSQTYTPAGQSQLQDIWNKVQGVASTPYQAYTGQQVANLDPTQTQGVANVNSAVGTAQPLFNQAIQYGQQGAAPISQDAIQSYISPYTQNVINSTQANFNEDNAQQQQQVLGNAAMKGALGGDRTGVAQAELARQQQLAQAPVIAGLQNNAYTQALGAAQQDRSAAAQGAYTFGSLAPAVQNTGIAGGNAQIAAGSVPQQNQQQQLSAQYQNYLQAQAFPYQQAQFLASYGLPAVTAQGGTQNGTSTTTQPGPNQWGQIAGLGLAGASLLSGNPFGFLGTGTTGTIGGTGLAGYGGLYEKGGRVKGYASGGSPMSAENFINIPSFIPQGQAPQSQAPKMSPMQMPQSKPQATAMPSAQALQSGLSGLGRAYNSLQLGDDGNGNWNDYSWDGGTPLDGSAAIGMGGIGSMANGGVVTSSPFIQGYDVGGPVDDLSFADRAFPAQDAVSNGMFDPQGANFTPFTQDHKFTPPAVAGNVPLPQSRPMMAQPSLPPQITNPDNTTPPDSAMAYSGEQPSGGLSAPATQPDQQPDQPQGKGGLFGTGFLANLSPEAKTGLLSAGLGMMASRSPFALTQIGEGGLQGVQAYTQAKKTAADEALRKQSADLSAQKLAQSAEQFAKTFGLQERTANRADLQPVKIGVDALGRDVYAIKDPKDGSLKPIDSMTGKVIDQNGAVAPSTAPQTNGTTPQDKPITVASNAPITPDTVPVGAATYTVPKDSPVAPSVVGVIDHPVNEKVLEGVNPAIAQQVKLLAAGRIAPPTSFAASKPYWQGLLSLAAQYDPQFDAVNYGARQAALKDMTSGPTAKNITSLNTVMQHIDELNNAGAALDNFHSGVASLPLNKATEALRAFQQDPRLARFNQSADAVATELERAFRGSQTALGGIKEWRNHLNPAMSPEERDASVKNLLKLLEGRIESVTDQYRRAFGSSRQPIDFLAPKAKEVYDRLSVGGGQPSNISSQPTTPQRVRQNNHTYERQPDGSMKAID